MYKKKCVKCGSFISNDDFEIDDKGPFCARCFVEIVEQMIQELEAKNAQLEAELEKYKHQQ